MKSTITDFMIRAIDIYCKYYAQGTLTKIEIICCVESFCTDIYLYIDGDKEQIDFDIYKIADESQERDAQRECYFENECFWPEFYIEMQSNYDAIRLIMDQVADSLKKHYSVDVIAEVKEDEDE